MSWSSSSTGYVLFPPQIITFGITPLGLPHSLRTSTVTSNGQLPSVLKFGILAVFGASNGFAEYDLQSLHLLNVDDFLHFLA